MPRTRTTRPKGNGPGWGGPAKGEGNGAPSALNVVRDGEEFARRQEVAAQKEPSRQEMLDFYVTVKRDSDRVDLEPNGRRDELARPHRRQAQAIDRTDREGWRPDRNGGRDP